MAFNASRAFIQHFRQRLGHGERARAVEIGVPLRLGVREAQDAADDLLDGRGGARRPEAAQHVGKRAVPSSRSFSTVMIKRTGQDGDAMSFTSFSSSRRPTEIFTWSALMLGCWRTSRSRSGAHASTRSACSSRMGRRYSPVCCASARASFSRSARRVIASPEQLVSLAGDAG
ncbi:MAG: hypothetical protein IPG14_10585 [Dehalococcoidia bacterium]|nr:hypothetical protein [Dehalococcoidia bacterium]